MIRQEDDCVTEASACISLAAAVLSATAVPAAGAVYAKGNGSETTVSEEGTIQRKKMEKLRRKTIQNRMKKRNLAGKRKRPGLRNLRQTV